MGVLLAILDSFLFRYYFWMNSFFSFSVITSSGAAWFHDRSHNICCVIVVWD